MSLIMCTDSCVYQKDGYCSLYRAASSGLTSSSSCINFVPLSKKALQQRRQSLPNTGNPDQFQSLRSD